MIELKQSAVSNRLLGRFSRDDFALVSPMLERVPLVLREVLVAANRPISHAYFVEHGVVSLIADTDGGRIEIGMVGREGVVGTPLILGSDQTPHSAMVQAEGDVLRISAVDLRGALDASVSLRGVLGRYVQGFVVQVGQTVYANTDFRIEARLARWVLMTHDRVTGSELRMTHEFLSVMLGVRRSGVTIAMCALESAGMIRSTRGRVVVCDREKLRGLAGHAYGPAEAEYERLLNEA